jgi:murein DD-endopeptidase MepM/ murein hydrolase activator NlpD
MSQKLIQAVNSMTVSASYLNTAYETKFGFKHYGFDCYGTSTTIWSQGYGVVLATGTDSCYGNYVVVLYLDVEDVGNVIANYFHMDSIAVKTGLFLSKDTRLGVMGKTGTYATGVHLHTEMRKYALGQKAQLSPFGTNSFAQDASAGWFDPLSIIYCKTSAPDSQKYTTTNDAYINSDNKTIKTTV